MIRQIADLSFPICCRLCTNLAHAKAVMLLCFPGALFATDLSDIYAISQQFDPTLRAAIASHRTALQQQPLARSAFRPQVDVGFDVGLYDINDDVSETFSATSFTLTVSQSIYHRSNLARLEQAGVSRVLADTVLEGARQNLILRVAERYFDVLRAEANLVFRRAELQAIARQRDQSEERFDVGLATIVDVRDAQAQFDLTAAREVAAESDLAMSREALRLLSGRAVDKLYRLKEEIPLVSPEPSSIDAWVQLAEDQNLDLTISRLATNDARLTVRAEQFVRFPTLDLLAIGSSNTTEQTGRADTSTGELRLQVRLPLYTGGRIQSQVARARAEVMIADAELHAQELATIQRTRDAYRSVLTNISRVSALRQALDSTRQSSESTEEGFRVGTRTSVDVLRALRDTFQVQSDFVNARYDYVLDILRLKSAAGTLNEEDIEAVNAWLEP